MHLEKGGVENFYFSFLKMSTSLSKKEKNQISIASLNLNGRLVTFYFWHVRYCKRSLGLVSMEKLVEMPSLICSS